MVCQRKRRSINRKAIFFFITKQVNHPIIRLSLKDYNRKNSKKYTLEDLKNPDIFAVVAASINSKHIYQAYSSNPKEEPQRSIRNTQVEAIADSFGKIVSAYNPIDIIVLMSGLVKNKKILFNPAIKMYHDSESKYQLATLHKPKIVTTPLENVGVVGAAAYFLAQKESK